MQIAYFDCQFGAAGDMLMGALLGAGLSEDRLREELDKIALPKGSFDLIVEEVIRCSIACKKVSVLCGPERLYEAGYAELEHVRLLQTANKQKQNQLSEKVRSSPGLGSHDHKAALTPEGEFAEIGEQPCLNNHCKHHHEGSKRSLKDILAIIQDSAIHQDAKQLASRIFIALGEAEAKVHSTSLEEVHFHEVGAIDAIVDIVGFAIGYQLLSIEKSYVSPVPLGSGSVRTEHGTLPVPAPAVVLLLSQAQAAVSNLLLDHECLTPTGAAILSTIAAAWTTPGFRRIQSVGYGAGTFDPSQFPNACRVFLGFSDDTDDHLTDRFKAEIVLVLEANLDDLSPQSLSFAVERLLESGALDVTVSPAVMKKGRSGHILTVICKPGDKSRLENIILSQTTTLGIRSHLCQRVVAEREWQEIELDDGWKIRIKIGKDLSGNIINFQPEYDDCAKYAVAFGVPLKEVLMDAVSRVKLMTNKAKDEAV